MSAEPAAAPAARSAVPAYLTRFVGRAAELAVLRDRVRNPAASRPEDRLCVLVGLGGAGKTRLMVELAHRLATEPGPAPVGDVWWVDLTTVSADEDVLAGIALAVGLPGLNPADPTTSLVGWLHRSRGLLLLDGCEHVLAGCRAAWSALLAGCPGLMVVATSRVPAHDGRELTLGPLTVPEGAHTADPGDAVELFYDRADRLLPGYRAASHDQAAVVELCRRLGGLPLAIELVVPWLRTLSATDLLARVDTRMELTSADHGRPDRHHALQAVLAGTWTWLSSREQQVLRALSTFVGGFTLAAAEEVADADLITLAALTERAVIRRVPTVDDDTRFVLHELVRRYAADRLAELPVGDADVVRRRHLRHQVACAELFVAARTGPDEARWLIRMERESANLDTALRWGLDQGESELVLRLVAAMKDVWIYTGSVDRHERAIMAALDQPWDEASPVAAAAHAVVAYAAGWSEFGRGDLERSRRRFVESLTINRRLGDTDQEAVCLRALGRLAYDGGDPAGAVRLIREGLAICRRTDNDLGVAWSLTDLAEIPFAEGDVAGCGRLLEEAIVAFRRLDDAMGLSVALVGLGEVRRAQSRWVEALAAYREGLQVSRRANVAASVCDLLAGSAAIAVGLHRAEDAARLLGLADTWNTVHGRWAVLIAVPTDDARRAARLALGEAAWASAYAAASGLVGDQTLALGDELITALVAVAGEPRPGGLTDREAEVLAGLLEGLSNDEIAGRLIVSPRTVHAHLRSIFRKLDVSSRTAAVHAATRLGLG